MLTYYLYVSHILQETGSYHCEKEATEYRQNPALLEVRSQGASLDEIHPREWVNWLPYYFQLFSNEVWMVLPLTLLIARYFKFLVSNLKGGILTYSYGIFFTLL